LYWLWADLPPELHEKWMAERRRRDPEAAWRRERLLWFLAVRRTACRVRVAVVAASPFSLQWSQENVALSINSPEARIGLTSVAGVHRRVYAGHTAARLMQPPIPATTRRSRTRAITGP